jgi:hypothetical protein
MLKAAICAVEGVKDHRTINNRITLLNSGHLVRQYDPEFKLYEIITGYEYSDGHMQGV